MRQAAVGCKYELAAVPTRAWDFARQCVSARGSLIKNESYVRDSTGVWVAFGSEISREPAVTGPVVADFNLRNL